MTKSIIESDIGSYSSRVFNLGEDTFLDHYFSIPIYQRLYVWGEEQVELLVEDILNSFQHERDLYLGNILLKNSTGNTFELIDGQQRFTTLWLLFNFIEAQIDEKTFSLQEGKPRLQFSIREDVAQFLSGIPSSLKKGGLPNASESSPDMQRMLKALSIIKTRVSEKFNERDNQVKSLRDLHKFLLDKVHLIVTFVPVNTDLNKLFELINGRGVQLQQHEILKAIIIEKASPEKRIMYGRIWDVCADMNHYVHRNLKNALVNTDGEKSTYTWKDYFKENPHSKSLEELETLFVNENGQQSGGEKSLAEILDFSNQSSQGIIEQPSKQDKPDDFELSEPVESIISFPTLLLYALATFDSNFITNQKDALPEYIDKNLINIFRLYLEKSNNYEKFMYHLFKIRVVFDENVIKFVAPTEKEKQFGLNRLPAITKLKLEENKSSNSISTTWLKQGSDDWSLLTQLQAMLYHAFTRTTQYWLIPYLKNLVASDSNNDPELEFLMKIDHQLYASKAEGTVLQKAIDFSVKEHGNPNFKIKEETANYHYYGQYWFYKVDWIIYYFLLSYKGSLPVEFEGFTEMKTAADNFIFTARNSVEHIYPQKDGAGKEWLHNFGNLVLISVGMNSAYSDLPILEKRAKHETFKQKNSRSETLKLDLFYKQFNEQSGSADVVKNHQEICVKLLQAYNEFLVNLASNHY